MKSHRIAILIAGLLVALASATPALAHSTTLLSGYGGPGQGNQAVLGATMLGGRGGGSGGGNGSGNAGSSASESPESPSIVAGREPSVAVTGGKSPTATTTPGASQTKAGGTSSGSAGAHQRAKGSAPAPSAVLSLYPASEHIPSGGQGDALGLSAADLIYIILGAGILLGFGVFTRRLGAPGSEHGARG